MQLKALGIRDVLGFDFMNPPPRAALLRSLELLLALGALDSRGDLTQPTGGWAGLQPRCAGSSTPACPACLPAFPLLLYLKAHSLAGRDAAAAAHAQLECKWAQSNPARGAGVFVGWRAAP